MSKLTAPGWDIPSNATMTCDGLIEWYDKADHTYWLVRPWDGASRHKGDGAGCIWTDWDEP